MHEKPATTSTASTPEDPDLKEAMTEERIAVILSAVRRLAHNADRRGTLIDPRVLLDVIEGKKQ